MTPLVFRALERELLGLAPHLAGQRVHGVRPAAALPGRHGPGARRSGRRAHRRRRRPPLPRVRGPGPAGGLRDAQRRRRRPLGRDGRREVDGPVHAAWCTPPSPRATCSPARAMAAGVRAGVAAAAFLLVAALLGGVTSRWAPLAVPDRRAARRDDVGGAVRLLGGPRERPDLLAHHAPGHHPALPVLGHVLPRQPAPRRDRAAGLAVAALARRRGRPHGHRRAASNRSSSCTWACWWPSPPRSCPSASAPSRSG